MLHIEYEGDTYAVHEELEDIEKGALCYDIMIKQVYISNNDYPANLPGLTGRNMTKL